MLLITDWTFRRACAPLLVTAHSSYISFGLQDVPKRFVKRPFRKNMGPFWCARTTRFIIIIIHGLTEMSFGSREIYGFHRIKCYNVRVEFLSAEHNTCRKPFDCEMEYFFQQNSLQGRDEAPRWHTIVARVTV